MGGDAERQLLELLDETQCERVNPLMIVSGDFLHSSPSLKHLFEIEDMLSLSFLEENETHEVSAST